MSGFYASSVSPRRIAEGCKDCKLTLAFFLFTPALVWGNGAGAAFLVPALGGYH